MEPLALTPNGLARALEVLGPSLERWQAAIRDRSDLATRVHGEYDLATDGPKVEDATIWVGRRHLALLLGALDDLEMDIPLPELADRMAALNPVRGALAWLGG